MISRSHFNKLGHCTFSLSPACMLASSRNYFGFLRCSFVSREGWRPDSIIPCLFFYSAITGFHVSSVRAATMAGVLLGGIFFDAPHLL